MGRLIDEDELIKGRVENDPVVIAAKCAPAAYDLDKVVEQLVVELYLADKEKERCARENPLGFDSTKGYATGLSNALEIVKAGGNADLLMDRAKSKSGERIPYDGKWK